MKPKIIYSSEPDRRFWDPSDAASGIGVRGDRIAPQYAHGLQRFCRPNGLVEFYRRPAVRVVPTPPPAPQPRWFARWLFKRSK